MVKSLYLCSPFYERLANCLIFSAYSKIRQYCLRTNKYMVLTSYLATIAVCMSLQPCPDCTRAEMREKHRFGMEYIAQETDLPVGFIWSYFISETGGKSPALVKGFNYGGIQVKGKTLKYGSVWEGVQAWIRVLNQTYYDSCRPLEGPELQQCFRKKYYHGGTWEYRWKIQRRYERFYKEV